MYLPQALFPLNHMKTTYLKLLRQFMASVLTFLTGKARTKRVSAHSSNERRELQGKKQKLPLRNVLMRHLGHPFLTSLRLCVSFGATIDGDQLLL